jgi:UV DNA damage endonuclease
MMRLGFPVRVLGSPNLPAYDARSWPAGPDFSVGLAYLHDILRYLRVHDLHMYRMHSRLVPNLDSLTMVARALSDSGAQLAALERLARDAQIRLSFHAPANIVLNAANEAQADEAAVRLASYAAFLNAMELGPEAVVVLHVGGVYDHKEASLSRFCRRFDALPGAVRSRLALEQDDRRFGYADVRRIHERCGVPLVLDTLHHQVLNPESIPLREALEASLATWPQGVTPKVHFSSPRTEMHPAQGAMRARPPRWTEHSDLVNPFEFVAFLDQAQGLTPFDIMLEARARDLAVLQLRQDMVRFAPLWSATLI